MHRNLSYAQSVGRMQRARVKLGVPLRVTVATTFDPSRTREDVLHGSSQVLVPLPDRVSGRSTTAHRPAAAQRGRGGLGRVECDHEVTTMAKLRNVGVREFRDHATSYLSGSDPVAISKHGRVIGFYVPLARDEDEVQRAVAKLGETVGQVLEESGLSEDELAALFDLRGPHIQ